MTPQTQNPLDNLSIATPCRARWSRMELVEGDRVRFCRTCEKNVYNITLMSRAEAEALLLTHEGNLCVNFARRADGTILTNDCPIGKIGKRDKAGALSVFFAVLLILIPSPVGRGIKHLSAFALRTVPAFSAVQQTGPLKTFFTWLDEEPKYQTLIKGCPALNN